MQPVGVAARNEREFPSWPQFEHAEIQAATRVLASGKVNYWTGDECRAFESEYARHVGVNHAVAVTNGTVALELALYAVGVGEGDEVITTCRTFIASASAVVMRGAVPVIADVDRDSGNITAETIAPLITKRTKAIIPVHLAGWPCDMDSIMALAHEHGLWVIEDCAQAHGAVYNGRPVGALGHVGCFSFCQDKILTTGGEGGLLVTDDEDVWRRAWSFKDHGKSFEQVYETEHPPGFRWLHESFGTNWRMLEVQAAVGRVQLRKLLDWRRARRFNAAILNDGLSQVPALRITVPPSNLKHAYYKYYAYVRPELLKPSWNRDRIMREVSAHGIPCFSGSCSEIYREKAFQDAGLGPTGRLPVAAKLGETSLMFLVHPTLSEEDMYDVVDVVHSVCAQASQQRLAATA